MNKYYILLSHPMCRVEHTDWRGCFLQTGRRRHDVLTRASCFLFLTTLVQQIFNPLHSLYLVLRIRRQLFHAFWCPTWQQFGVSLLFCCFGLQLRFLLLNLNSFKVKKLFVTGFFLFLNQILEHLCICLYRCGFQGPFESVNVQQLQRVASVQLFLMVKTRCYIFLFTVLIRKYICI